MEPIAELDVDLDEGELLFHEHEVGQPSSRIGLGDDDDGQAAGGGGRGRRAAAADSGSDEDEEIEDVRKAAAGRHDDEAAGEALAAAVEEVWVGGGGGVLLRCRGAGPPSPPAPDPPGHAQQHRRGAKGPTTLHGVGPRNNPRGGGRPLASPARCTRARGADEGRDLSVFLGRLPLPPLQTWCSMTAAPRAAS